MGHHDGVERGGGPGGATPARPTRLRPGPPAARRVASADPVALTQRDFVELQAFAGNAAVSRLLTIPTISSRRTVQRASVAKGEGAQPWVRPGDSGPNVTRVQQRLNAIGAPGTPLAESGVYGAAMRSTVNAFQTTHGLDPDGIVGPLTSEALDREDSAGTDEAVAVGTDHTGTADAPTQAEIDTIENELNPTSTGSTTEWDGRADPAKRTELDTEITTAMQTFLNDQTPKMKKKEAAKAAGQVVSTTDMEGAGRAAKVDADAQFGGLASAAVLTAPQEAARASFEFKAGVNLFDASDRTPNAADAADWIFETNKESTQAQTNHGFNERRSTDEATFADGVKARFLAAGSNSDDLDRLDRFGFAFAEEGPRVFAQTSIVDSPGFSATPKKAGGMSDAERLRRWRNWEVLVHEYFHTLAHPSFNAAAGGNRILTEGFCELFTKAVLLHGGAIDSAQKNADAARRQQVEGGDVPDFEARFVPDYSPSEYKGFLEHAETIEATVGADAVRAAFFLGHVEHIGLKPDGEMIDPAAPDAKKFLAPERVTIPSTVRSVGAVSILTGAPETDIVSANPGLAPTGPLPASAHTTGLVVPGTTHHRTLEVRDRAGNVVTETKADIAVQHGVSEHSIQRANPALNHREPKPGEWVLIPVH